MTNFDEIASLLRHKRTELLPSQLAALSLREADGPAGQYFLIDVFGEAFPEIPLRQLIRASRWNKVCENGLSDEEFDAILKPWLPRAENQDG